MRIIRNRKNKANLVKNQRGQGATEYILMLAVLIAVVFLAKDKIKGFIGTQMGNAETGAQTVWQ